MSEIYWGIYKFLHDAPGTPKELKCVNCKIATGGLSMATALGCTVGLFKTLKTRPIYAAWFGIGAICFTGAAGFMFKTASVDYMYNQRLIANTREQTRRERLSKREIMASQ